MGFGDFLNEAGSKILGISDMAYIIFHAESKKIENMDEDDAAALGKGFSLINDLGGGDTALAAAGRALGNNAAISELSKVNLVGGVDENSKKFTFKFNPLKISIDGINTGNYTISTYGAADKGNAGQSVQSRITVRIDVLFDDVNNVDAFASDKTNISAAGLVKTAVTLGSTLGSGRTYTVRPQVEGFHASLRVFDKTAVTFVWGNQIYEGEFIGFSSRYTMFSPNGNPIRATGTINILCSQEQRLKWQATTRELVTNYAGAQTMKAGQYVSGLLNI